MIDNPANPSYQQTSLRDSFLSFRNSRKNIANPTLQKPCHSIDQVIETFKIYLKSANDLKNNLQISIKNQSHPHPFSSLNKSNLPIFLKDQKIIHSPVLKADEMEDSELRLVISKVELFVLNCQQEVHKINKAIESSSLEQMQSLGSHYQKVLSFLKEKYSQLLKEAYRTLNMENIDTFGVLSREDKTLIKQNRRRKLQQINTLERQMEILWHNPDSPDPDINDLSAINGASSIRKAKHKKKPLEENEQESKSFIVTLEDKKTNKPRNLQVLGLEVSQINLRQFAKQQLQKQFLAIRIQAYNMYEKYVSHNHQQFQESLKFLNQEQEILQNQLEQQSKLSQSIKQQYHRLRRELSEIKTINELIRKRYVIRESIRIDSEDPMYD